MAWRLIFFFAAFLIASPVFACEDILGFGNAQVSVLQGRFSSSTLGQITGLDKNAVQLRIIATSSQIANIQNWETPTSTVAYITNLGNFHASGTLFGSSLSLSGSGTTTFNGGVQATLLNITSNSATSTFGNGIQLNGGCFRDGSGTCITAGVAGANTALSNLAAVAINTSLLSDTANTDDLGSYVFPWKDIYASGTLYTSALSVTGAATSTFANGLEIDAGCYLLPNGACLPTTGGNAGRPYYPENSVASDLTAEAYKVALASPSANAKSTVSISAITQNEWVYGESFATASGEPNVTSLPAGTAYRYLYSAISGGTGEVKAELYRYQTTGNVATTGAVSFTYNENGASADTITRGSGSFIADGFTSGVLITVTGTVSNDGTYVAQTVSALTLTLRLTLDDLALETVSSTITTKEKLLRTGMSPSFTNSAIALLAFTYSDATAYAFSADDRIIFKWWGRRTSVGPTRTITIDTEGTTTASYIQTTIGEDLNLSGANTALSNLATVVINTSLLSDTNNTDDLGAFGFAWKNLYASGTLRVGNAILAGDTLRFSTGTIAFGATSTFTASPTLDVAANSVHNFGLTGNLDDESAVSLTLLRLYNGAVGSITGERFAVDATGNAAASGSLYIASGATGVTRSRIRGGLSIGTNGMTLPAMLTVGAGSDNLTAANPNGSIAININGTADFVARDSTNNAEVLVRAYAGGVQIGATTNNDVYLLSNSAVTAQFNTTGFIPGADNTITLGQVGRAWSRVQTYALNASSTAVMQDIRPAANNLYDLGGFASAAWRDIYASGTLYAEDFVLESKGTSTASSGISTTALASSASLTVSGATGTSTLLQRVVSTGIQSTGGLTVTDSSILAGLTVTGSAALTGGATITCSSCLTDANLTDALTVSGGDLQANSVGSTWTTTSDLTIGDNGDAIIIKGNNWLIGSTGNFVFLGSGTSTVAGNLNVNALSATSSLSIGGEVFFPATGTFRSTPANLNGNAAWVFDTVGAISTARNFLFKEQGVELFSMNGSGDLAATGTITSNGLLPLTRGIKDIGTFTLPWRQIYASGTLRTNEIINQGTANTAEVNRALCQLSTGLIGTCSSVVAADGTCTCQ